MLREVGINLFLACVGLKSGDRFVETLVEGDGMKWMALASLITLVPLMTVALVARLFMKVNYLTLCGLLAGSMTDPPALAFAGTVTGSEAPMVSYATVYPLTMILRVICAQLIVLLFMT
jgi:putative transport protein